MNTSCFGEKKSMKRLFSFLSIVLTLASITFYLGCSEIFEKEGTAAVIGYEIFISENRPAEVWVAVTSIWPDGGFPTHKAHKHQIGNRIHIDVVFPTGTGDSSGYVTSAVEFPTVLVSIGTLHVGEWTVDVNGIEQKFHIEEENKPWTVHAMPGLEISKMETLISVRQPALVVLKVTGRLFISQASRSTAINNEHQEVFWDIHQEREGETIYVQMTSKTPGISALNLYDAFSTGGDYFPYGHEVEEQIHIGRFTTGEYKVILNGTEQVLRIE